MENEALLNLICEKLVEQLSPELVVFFGEKYAEDGISLRDIDVCVVSELNESRRDALKKAYLAIDTDIPFDIFLYTPDEWKRLTADSGSFASRALRKGKVRYEKG